MQAPGLPAMAVGSYSTLGTALGLWRGSLLTAIYLLPRDPNVGAGLPAMQTNRYRRQARLPH